MAKMLRVEISEAEKFTTETFNNNSQGLLQVDKNIYLKKP